MPVYEYKGINKSGKHVSGIMEADGEKGARNKLRKTGIYPTDVYIEGTKRGKLSLSSDVNLGKYFQRVKSQDVAVMTRQLSTLISANISLVDSLTALVEQTANLKLKRIIGQVKERVVEGGKFADALLAHKGIFTTIYVNMVNAGEMSGSLDVVLERLADFTEGQAKLKSKVVGALTYPLVMGGVGLLLVGFLMTAVVPKVTKIFMNVKVALPLPTRVLIGVSDAISGYWYIFILVGALFFYLIRRWLKTEKGREVYDGYMLKLPLFGRVLRMVAISRFARTLATLLKSGVQLLQALDIVKNVVDNVHIAQAIADTREEVREGESVSEPLRRSGYFPPIVIHMIAIGEKTGQMEKMLERVADDYDLQVDNTVSTLTTLLEPFMILMMGGIVTFIVLSILLPILKLNQLGG